MHFLKTAGKSLFRMRYGYDMNMIIHQAVGPNLYPVGRRKTAKQVQVEMPIAIRKEDDLIAIPSLGDVMRGIRNNNSDKSRRASMVSGLF